LEKLAVWRFQERWQIAAHKINKIDELLPLCNAA
jgi:hypothetical protein